MSRQIRTFQMRLARGPHEAALDAFGEVFGRAERYLHARLGRLHATAQREQWDTSQRREAKNALKRDFMVEHGLTGRQYNALLISLEGKHDSLRELAKLRIEENTDKLDRLRRKIAKIEEAAERLRETQADVAARAEAGKPPTKVQAKVLAKRREVETGLKRLYHWRCKCDRLESRIAKDKTIAAAAVPPMVFGSKQRLRERSRIGANDIQRCDAWRRDWERARSGQVMCLGSKSETQGCQSCVAALGADGTIGLRVRLPKALEATLGKHLVIPGHALPAYARDALNEIFDAHAARTESRRAVTYRFVRDVAWSDRNTLSAWRVCITVEAECPAAATASFDTRGWGKRAAEVIGPTPDFIGAIGVDVNADQIAWCKIDRFGNPCKAACGRIPLPLRGESSARRAAIIGDACARLVEIARAAGLPLVLEALDFKAKKREMKDKRNAGYARMLSSFAYSQIQTTLRRRAQRAGVECVEVNPAYTSIIGRVNIARRYGLSAHMAAACAIARRAGRFSERINYAYGYRGKRHTLPSRSETGRHMWQHWADLLREVRSGRGPLAKRLAAGSVLSIPSPHGADVKAGSDPAASFAPS